MHEAVFAALPIAAQRGAARARRIDHAASTVAAGLRAPAGAAATVRGLAAVGAAGARSLAGARVATACVATARIAAAGLLGAAGAAAVRPRADEVRGLSAS